jgi:hypothetical protein
MKPQFITNDKGEKTAVIIPISEYEDLLHKRHLTLEVTNGYKVMIDKMLDEEDNGTAEYVSFETIKAKFLKA